ncbi:MAG: succinate dehydrogenase cytochrome b subunit [Bacteriovoracaceae bacterium]|nr:succinate dehydrogenase cytochrome b subunit [Bacteriovoracaceae bacterium]
MSSETGDAAPSGPKFSFLILQTSVGRKYLVAITGLLSCGFLLGHLAGNLLLLMGPDSFNSYAHKLTSTSLIYVAEAILGVIFLVHLGLALKLNWENKMARPQKYVKKKTFGPGENIFSSTMPYTGIAILVFLVLHLTQFKFGSVYMTQVEGVEMRDVYRTVIEFFKNIWSLVWYCVAMSLLAMHLAHGVQSSFQSLGIRSKQIGQWLKCGSRIFAFGVPAGFIFLSIWCHLQ